MMYDQRQMASHRMKKTAAAQVLPASLTTIKNLPETDLGAFLGAQ